MKKTKDNPSQARRWEIFIPAIDGPPRLVRRKFDGLEYRRKEKRPELPPNQNERLHWRVKSKVIANWRSHTAVIVRSAGIPSLQRVKISAIIHRRTIGKADWSGDLERLKPIVDAMVDLGIVPDDRRQFVEYGSIAEERLDERGLGVTIILEELRSNGTDLSKGKNRRR